MALDTLLDAVEFGVVPRPGDFPNHRYLLQNDIPLIENLVNLETFDDVEFGIISMPLKILHCDGALARVIAVTEGLNLDFLASEG